MGENVKKISEFARILNEIEREEKDIFKGWNLKK
jgi:hypothetical protein